MRYSFTKSMLATLKITSIKRMDWNRLTDVLIINDQGEILKSIEYDFEGKPKLEATYIYNSANGRIEKEVCVKPKMTGDISFHNNEKRLQMTEEISYLYNQKGQLVKKTSMQEGEPSAETIIDYADNQIVGEITSKDGIQMVKATYEYSDKKIITKKSIEEKTKFGRREENHEYDDAGLLRSKVVEIFLHDERVDGYAFEKLLYNQQNRLIEIDETLSFPKGSSAETKTVFEFNDDGYLFKEVSIGKSFFNEKFSNEYVYIYNESVNQ